MKSDIADTTPFAKNKKRDDVIQYNDEENFYRATLC